MAQSANIRTLQVLPSRSTDLCFSVAGIIALQNFNHQSKVGPAYIGQPVNGFDLNAQLYSHLSETVTDHNDPRFPGDPDARLKYDSGEIHKALALPPTGGSIAPYLFALRNETIAASLDQAIIRREGMYFERFKHAAAVRQAMEQAFPAILSNITHMQQDANSRFTAVDAAHAASGAPAVVQETKARTSVSGDYKVSSTTRQRNTISVNGEFDDPGSHTLDTRVKDPQDGNKHVQTHESDRLTGFPYRYNSGNSAWDEIKDDYYEAQKTDTLTAGEQITKSENPAFFHPRLDNSISHSQLQSALAGEKMSQTIASLSAGHMDRIIADEKAAADLEVRRLQVTFAETYLTSPIAGVVTAVFKDIGECVQPGEPVLRVENDSVVFLAGRVQFFGLLRIGQNVVVSATDLFEAGVVEDFPGRIRGIRGHQADDDEWEVLIECDNPLDAQGRRKLPIYYQFDRDTTKILVP